MTSWMKERDRLVEETLAFVEGVAAQRPAAAAARIALTAAADIIITADSAPPPDAVSPQVSASKMLASQSAFDAASAETDALISLMALSQPARLGDPAPPAPEPIAISRSPNPVFVTAKTVATPTAKRLVEMTIPERDVIASRVARFRAGQQKIIRQRDDDYAQVQAKIRATLGNDSPA